MEELEKDIKDGLWGEDDLSVLAKELGCAKTTLYNLRNGLPLECCRVGVIFKLMQRYKLKLDFEVNDGK